MASLATLPGPNNKPDTAFRRLYSLSSLLDMPLATPWHDGYFPEFHEPEIMRSKQEGTAATKVVNLATTRDGVIMVSSLGHEQTPF